jgi:hypothetical protein
MPNLSVLGLQGACSLVRRVYKVLPMRGVGILCFPQLLGRRELWKVRAVGMREREVSAGLT